jgi:hypothetical protein
VYPSNKIKNLSIIKTHKIWCFCNKLEFQYSNFTKD